MFALFADLPSARENIVEIAKLYTLTLELGYAMIALFSMIVYFVLDAYLCFFFFQAEDGRRDDLVTGVQTCALPILFAHGFLTADGQKAVREHIGRRAET